MKNWYHIPSPETSWLVDGLITSDGHAAICGKPKAGKSTFVRNLITSVIKGRAFLGRSIDLEGGTGRVLYIHLDRKDQLWRVVKELHRLGITEEESSRLTIMTAEDVPDTFDDRLLWLQKEAVAATPNLIVIDLLWQFILIQNANDYNETLKKINQLQDALTQVKFKGALVVTLHGRKANNPEDPADDILGSTGQRGSFSTLIMLSRRRKEEVYTITSDQTERDEHYGEIDETVLNREADGTLTLGQTISHLDQQQKLIKDEAALLGILRFIEANPGCEMEQIVGGLNKSKKTVLALLNTAPDLWFTEGKGIKGEPLRYFVTTDGKPKMDRMAVVNGFLN